jgi:hypothetical protein
MSFMDQFSLGWNGNARTGLRRPSRKLNQIQKGLLMASDDRSRGHISHRVNPVGAEARILE